MKMKLFLKTLLTILILSIYSQGCCCCSNLEKLDSNKSVNNNTSTQEVAVERIPPMQPEVSNNKLQENFFFYYNRAIYKYLNENESPEKLVEGELVTANPEDNKVAYSKLSEFNTGGLFIYDLNSRESKMLRPETESIGNIIWSPDGRYIAYIDRANNFALKVVTPDGSEEKTLIADKGQGIFMPFQPVWSIDSKSVIFHDMQDLYKINLDGEIISKEPIGKIAGDKNSISSEDRFTPSPTNTNFIAYTKYVDPTPEFEQEFGEPNTALFLYDESTGKSTRLSPVNMLAISPVWSKDGKYIYFTGYTKEHWNETDPFRIYRITPEGTGLKEIQKGMNPAF